MRGLWARALFVLSIVLGAYVIYAHAAAVKTSLEYSVEPLHLRFSGAGWDRDLAVRADGLEVSNRDGHLRISSPSDSTDSVGRAEIRGPARRLYDVEFTMRFRARRLADYDLALGVERADAPERVAFGLSNAHDGASYGFFGDERSDVSSGGTGLATQRYSPFERPDEEHEVALVIRPDLHLVLGLVDGVPVSSHSVGWDDGVLVRPLLYLAARAAAQPIDAEVFQADYAPLPRSSRSKSIDERFEGKVLDPVVWSVVRADGWNADGQLALTTAGLDLSGRALRRTQETPVLVLIGPPGPLGSFHASIELSIRTLRHARMYFGVSNLLAGLTDWRLFEAGVVDGPTHLDPYVAGHWEGDSQLAIESLPGASAATPPREIALDYDAQTRTGYVSFDGRIVAARRLDFQPPERIRVELGARVLDGDGAFEVNVRHVVFEPVVATDRQRSLRLDPSDPKLGAFEDVFGTDTRAAYHVLVGTASWGPARLQLGPDAPAGDEDHAVVRGFFDRPVSVSGSVHVADDPVRGDYDSVGVLATDHEGALRYAAVLWYGSRLPSEFRLTRQGAKGIAFLSSRPAELERDKNYWVKLRVERTKVYARYWPDEPGAREPDDWALEAPLENGWSATGGVGLVAHATKTWGSALRAE